MGAMTNLQPFFNHSFKGHEDFLKNPFIGQKNLSTTELNRASVMDRKSVDISLVTAEGDIVTISLDSFLEESYTGYNSKGHMGGIATKTQMETFGSFSSREMLLTLEGDLNEEELADIQRVLGQIESLASDFFTGEIDEVVAKAMQFGDMGSIVGLQANLEYTYSMSIERQYTAKMTGTTSEPPETVTEKERPMAGDNVRRLIDEMIKTVGDSNVKPGKMAKVLPKFIDYLFDKYLAEDDSSGPNQEMAKSIKSELLQALPEKMISNSLADSNNVEDLESEEKGYDV